MTPHTVSVPTAPTVAPTHRSLSAQAVAKLAARAEAAGDQLAEIPVLAAHVHEHAWWPAGRDPYAPAARTTSDGGALPVTLRARILEDGTVVETVAGADPKACADYRDAAQALARADRDLAYALRAAGRGYTGWAPTGLLPRLSRLPGPGELARGCAKLAAGLTLARQQILTDGPVTVEESHRLGDALRSVGRAHRQLTQARGAKPVRPAPSRRGPARRTRDGRVI